MIAPTKEACMAVTDKDLLRKKTLGDLKDRHEDLPLLPAVIARVAQMDPDDDDFVDSVEDLAHCDPTFTVRLLKMANHGMFKKDNDALTIEQAIVRVGAMRLADIVRLHNVVRTFVPTNFGQRFLWFHTLEVAVGARMIANAMPGGDLNPDVAYAAGMLHDVGRFVMFNDSPDELGQINESFWGSFPELQAKELEICGYDHAELGGMALEEWALPKPFALVATDHHSREEDLQGPLSEEQTLLLRVVQCADSMSLLLHDAELRQLSTQPRRERLREKLTVYGWDRLPLAVDILEGFFESIDDEATRKAASIGVKERR
jgi:putative nucleotidyltransferase with HDIG domain